MSVRLPFSNRYVFAKVMQDNPELCQEFVGRILDIRIGHIVQIQVEAETVSIVRRSVRFDVFLESNEAAFEVEMQTYEQRDLPLRMRYYRSQLDRRLLNEGADFTELKPVYIIFICTSDPFGFGLPVYTFRSRCVEQENVSFPNGAIDLVLNSAGDLTKARPQIASLLQYVATDAADAADALTSRLDHAVEEAHEDEEWVKSMSWLDWDIRDAKAEAAREGRADGLAEGRAEGCAEGQTDERSRMTRLVAAMTQAGCEPAAIVSAMGSGELDAFYERYGISDRQGKVQ